MKSPTKNSSFVAPFLFYLFLERNNIREKFLAVFAAQNFESVDIFLDRSLPSTYISAAFSWSVTPEGGPFWSNIHTRWTNVAHLFNLR